MRWIGPVLLTMILGCAVGETRPEAPSAPGAEPAQGAERAPARPELPPAEAERRAAEAVAAATRAYERGATAEAADLAGAMLRDHPGTALVDSALWLGARAAYAAGRYEEAREWAGRYGRRQTAGSPARAQAGQLEELATDALSQPTATAVVGALLPRSGSDVLVQYGDWVLEGIELAIREAARRRGRPVELVVADDGGGARTSEAVAELERRGAMAIIGPLLPQQLAEAVGARVDPRLMIVSPTITEVPGHWSNVYSVAGGDTYGARELALYAAQAGLLDAAILHARGLEHHSRAQAFATEYQTRGGRIRATVSYESGTTTFASHMQQILQAARGSGAGTAGRPFILFVAAPDRDVPQIAPQISFYGLDGAGVQVLGDHAWASPSVRRLVPSRDLEGVVAASPLPAGRADGVADPEFVTLFENTYRRSLTNPLPALGFDAARLVLEALPNRLLTPGATARSFELLAGIHGATGTLSVRGGRLVRTPYLVVIRNGQLEPAPVPGGRVGGPGS
jgi:ABC-type branched-subunit amino acid transport system substrate-binding protein